MIQGQACPRNQTEHGIGRLKVWRRGRETCLGQPLHQAICKIRLAQKAAFGGEVAHFVKNIDHPQLQGGFHPVEDHRRIGQAQVFGPQVSMPLNHQTGQFAFR